MAAHTRKPHATSETTAAAAIAASRGWNWRLGRSARRAPARVGSTLPATSTFWRVGPPVAGCHAAYPEAVDEEGARPRAPLGHLAHLGFALVGAGGVDEITRALLTDLVALPGVTRVGIALTEGGGRRLRFTASDRLDGDDLGWCHIDAYDDVPLTRVVRTGESVLGRRDEVDRRYAAFVAKQPPEVAALAAVPLPGVGSPIGGLVLYFDDSWDLTERQRRLLEATARRTSEALRRVRAVGTPAREPADAEPDQSTVTATVQLDDDPRSAGVARRFLRGFLAEAGIDDDVAETALLCLSELVTNAVVHAGSPSDVTATLDHVLTVTLRDHGGAGRETRVDPDPDPMRVHGRGLQLVDALADRWGAEPDATGTTVWFVLELDRPDKRPADRTG